MCNVEQKVFVKKRDMEQLAKYRQYLSKHPRLTYLFIELTDICNLCCMHCGSHCSPAKGTYIDTDLLLSSLKEISEDFDPDSVMVCLSGGEPLLHPDFFKIVSGIADLGFSWGITTNGTLIDEDAAAKMQKYGLGSVTISIDGLEASHDWLRQCSGAYQKAVSAVSVLCNFGFQTQATSVIHKKNLVELEAMFRVMCELNVCSWRIINMEPIGRAIQNKDLLLSAKQMYELLLFIQDKRFDKRTPMDIRFGCSHYLSYEFEHEVRENYFICGSGTYVGSILCNGDIFSCLDIARRPDLIQGNIRHDRFSDVWKNRFQVFRQDRGSLCKSCSECDERSFCCGDSAHTWNYETNEPMFCYKEGAGQ